MSDTACVSASPLRKHFSERGLADLALHVEGLPGSDSPMSETLMAISPAVGGLKIHRYVPSPRSTTLARTRVPRPLARMATKKLSPPVVWRRPASSWASMVKEATCHTSALVKPSPDMRQQLAALGARPQAAIRASRRATLLKWSRLALAFIRAPRLRAADCRRVAAALSSCLCIAAASSAARFAAI